MSSDSYVKCNACDAINRLDYCASDTQYCGSCDEPLDQDGFDDVEVVDAVTSEDRAESEVWQREIDLAEFNRTEKRTVLVASGPNGTITQDAPILARELHTSVLSTPARFDSLTCVNCKSEYRDVAIYRFPMDCPICGSIVRLSA